MHTIQFLGSGSGLCDPAFNYHSNILIGNNTGNPFLLYDCGSHFQMSLAEAGHSIFDIGGIFISHLHADHVGGLEYFAFKRCFVPNKRPDQVPIIIDNVELLDELWNKTLSGGMESLQGSRNTLSSYFRIKDVPPNGEFCWFDTVYQPIQTVHVVDDRRIKLSFGIMINFKRKVFITGDTQFSPNQIMTFYEMADCIFQDCELADYKGSVHAQYNQLKTLPEHIKNKMWLYHYSGALPDYEKDGFRGFVAKGQYFEFE